jgi:hypothetical protein
VANALVGDLWHYTATIPAIDAVTGLTYSISVTDGYTSDGTLPNPVLFSSSP